MNASFVHAMPFGAAVQDGGVRFRLWAPGQRQVSLLLSGSDQAISMQAQADGWFELTSAEARGGSDLIEAGLGVPKGDFTVVIGDTRRLSLPAGAVAKVTTDEDPSSISLSRALAVDDAGARRGLTVVVP